MGLDWAHRERRRRTDMTDSLIIALLVAAAAAYGLLTLSHRHTSRRREAELFGRRLHGARTPPG